MSDQWYPEPTKEQQEKEAAEHHRLVSSMPVLQDILDWFDTQAEYFNTAAGWTIDETTPEKQVKEIVMMCKHFSSVYIDEKRKFATQFASYIEKEAEENKG